MQVHLSRLILYCDDVDRLKGFYRKNFGFSIVEEIAGEWAVLDAGACELALHRAGEPFRGKRAARGHGSTAKVVFTIGNGLEERRTALISAGVAMREIKRFAGFAYTLCDGEDPEGNVFQLSQPD